MNFSDTNTGFSFHNGAQQLQEIESQQQRRVQFFDQIVSLYEISASHQSNLVFFDPDIASQSEEIRSNQGLQMMQVQSRIEISQEEAPSNTPIPQLVRTRARKQPSEKRGCNCSQSYCQSKHCVCHKKGISCSQECKCKICNNFKTKRIKKAVMVALWSINDLK